MRALLFLFLISVSGSYLVNILSRILLYLGPFLESVQVFTVFLVHQFDLLELDFLFNLLVPQPTYFVFNCPLGLGWTCWQEVVRVLLEWMLFKCICIFQQELLLESYWKCWHLAEATVLQKGTLLWLNTPANTEINSTWYWVRVVPAEFLILQLIIFCILVCYYW